MGVILGTSPTILRPFLCENIEERSRKDQKERQIVKLISLNVGRPRLMVYQGRTINTGIFKQPVSGPVPLAHVKP